MDLTVRVMAPNERNYSYTQSHQLMMQTGCIGHLRGDFGSTGNQFFSSWDDHRPDLKTDEFKKEFDNVINALREDPQFGDILKNRGSLLSYCYKNADSKFNDQYSREYGFRADTQNHAYMLRLNPDKGAYNMYIYCYRRDWLDKHLDRAQKGIRFIDPNYNEKFRLPDGEKIRMTQPDGKTDLRTCRYIDDYHLEVGNNLYHICEFAERMEKAGILVEPEKPILPEVCFSTLPSSGEIIKIKRGETGYYRTNYLFESNELRQDYVDRSNRRLGVSKAQESAMLAGSMFGWNTPAADPSYYDKDGKPIPPSSKRKPGLDQQISNSEARANTQTPGKTEQEQER